jgi:sulfite exporter TauE/SafE
MQEINYTKTRFFPLFTITTDVSIDSEKHEITFEKENDSSTYFFTKMKNKTSFLLLKYIPVLLFISYFVTLYELQNMTTFVIVGFAVTTLGSAINKKYDDFKSFIATVVWFLMFSYIFGFENSGYIVKYALIAYFFYSFLADLKREYFQIIKNNKVVSYFNKKEEKIK